MDQQPKNLNEALEIIARLKRDDAAWRARFAAESMASPAGFEEALRETLEALKIEAVESWERSKTPEQREQLWHYVQAIGRLTEGLGNDFRNIVERAARRRGREHGSE